jgi:hypothetical protein
MKYYISVLIYVFNGRLYLFSPQGVVVEDNGKSRGGGGGGVRTMKNPGDGCEKGLGKSRGRGQKDHRNSGGDVIRDQIKLKGYMAINS